MTNRTGEGAGWPAGLMMVWGMVGCDAAGVRYQRRAAAALAAMVIGFVGSGLLGLRPMMAAVPGLGFVYIAYEFRRYLSAVDELSRRLLLESVYWAYLAAGIAAMFAAGIIAAYDLEFHPIWVIVGLMCVEGMRGIFLYLIARRYR